MLVNRNESEPHTVRVTFADSKAKHGFTGPVARVTFGSEQYVWKPDGAKGFADPDGPPAASVVSGEPRATFTLPKASITVLRGKIDEEAR